MNIIPLSQEIRLLVNFVAATEFPIDRIFLVTPSSTLLYSQHCISELPFKGEAQYVLCRSINM